jgi:hypothetical protein
MNEVARDISNSTLSISTIGQLVKLSKGQDALLKLIRESVANNKSIDWDVLVECFYHNVSKTISKWKWANMEIRNDFSRTYYDLDLLDEYKKNSSSWHLYGRGRVRQWFVSTIGILVVKGQLFVIPTIELE